MKSDSIRDLMGTNPTADEMTRSHKVWMDLLEEFIYCRLLDEDNRSQFEQDWFTDKEVWFPNARTTVHDWMIKQKSPKSSKASTSSS